MLVYRIERANGDGPYRPRGGVDGFVMSPTDLMLFSHLTKTVQKEYALNPCEEVRRIFDRCDTDKMLHLVDRLHVLRIKPPDMLKSAPQTVWGFENRTQLEQWFNDPCRKLLRRYDYLEAVYQCDEKHVASFSQQCAFRRDKAELINRGAL